MIDLTNPDKLPLKDLPDADLLRVVNRRGSLNPTHTTNTGERR